jgi:hypothetical protein
VVRRLPLLHDGLDQRLCLVGQLVRHQPAAGPIPATTLAVNVSLTIWHSYEFFKVILKFRKSSALVHTISNRIMEVGMKVIEFVMSTVSVVVGWSHVAAAE